MPEASSLELAVLFQNRDQSRFPPLSYLRITHWLPKPGGTWVVPAT